MVRNIADRLATLYLGAPWNFNLACDCSCGSIWRIIDTGAEILPVHLKINVCPPTKWNKDVINTIFNSFDKYIKIPWYKEAFYGAYISTKYISYVKQDERNFIPNR